MALLRHGRLFVYFSGKSLEFTHEKSHPPVLDLFVPDPPRSIDPRLDERHAVEISLFYGFGDPFGIWLGQAFFQQ
jgi:hypothetical protein